MSSDTPLRPPVPSTDEIARLSSLLSALRAEIRRNLIGQDRLVDRLLVGLLANGHVLIEGVPGLAKTLAVRTLASAINANFRRVQFTPDLLPGDIVGTPVYRPHDGTYAVHKGPVFTHLLLADEINRAPAKVQSALLEAMQERQVTLGNETYALPSPFLVLATENPIDQEGTYPLPEAQADRFMLKLRVTYPGRAEERAILDTLATTEPPARVNAVLGCDDILHARRLVNAIHVAEPVRDYIVNLIVATRDPIAAGLDAAHLIRYGASPRATLALTLAAKAFALLQGRDHVIPDDVKALAHDVLRHRLLITYEAEAEGVDADAIITRLLNTVPVV